MNEEEICCKNQRVDIKAPGGLREWYVRVGLKFGEKKHLHTWCFSEFSGGFLWILVMLLVFFFGIFRSHHRNPTIFPGETLGWMSSDDELSWNPGLVWMLGSFLQCSVTLWLNVWEEMIPSASVWNKNHRGDGGFRIGILGNLHSTPTKID